MTYTDAILGSPPRSWSTLKSDLIRLRRNYDHDDEDAASRHITALHPDRVRVRLIDQLLLHIEPAVQDEARFYDMVDRELDLAKERS